MRKVPSLLGGSGGMSPLPEFVFLPGCKMVQSGDFFFQTFIFKFQDFFRTFIKTSNFQDFSRPGIFHFKFQDFYRIPGPVGTLRESHLLHSVTNMLMALTIPPPLGTALAAIFRFRRFKLNIVQEVYLCDHTTGCTHDGQVQHKQVIYLIIDGLQTSQPHRVTSGLKQVCTRVDSQGQKNCSPPGD